MIRHKRLRSVLRLFFGADLGPVPIIWTDYSLSDWPCKWASPYSSLSLTRSVCAFDFIVVTLYLYSTPPYYSSLWWPAFSERASFDFESGAAELGGDRLAVTDHSAIVQAFGTCVAANTGDDPILTGLLCLHNASGSGF